MEFIYRGYFDGVDMAMMIHAGNMPEGKYLTINPGCNGCVVKNVTFEGVASHAGGSPEKGINALYAATTAMTAANALRETFLDNEHIRFHPHHHRGRRSRKRHPREDQGGDLCTRRIL